MKTGMGASYNPPAVLALLLLFQELDPGYLKEVAAIRKEHARGLFDLALAQGKAKRSPMLKVDLKRVIELDPENEAAKKLWDKVKDLPDETRVVDKGYIAKRKKVRDEVAKKYDALASQSSGEEADDAKKRAAEVRAESDEIPPTVEEVILKRLNEIRASCGLPEVTLDPALSKGCKLHAEYLDKNAGNPKLAGLSAHDEDASLPGATPDGAKAGKSSNIGYVAPEFAVDNWNDTFYHRVTMLQPTLKRVGAAHVKGGKSGNICLLNLTQGVEGKCDPKFGALAYPPDGAKGIGLAFSPENPNPVPDGAKGGYPITLTFFDGSKVMEVVATLHEGPPPKTKKDKLGAEVECFVSTPEKPATTWTQLNTVCIIAKQPLKGATTYTVKVTAKVNTAKFEKIWSFETK